jgi:ribosomal protein L3
MKDTRIVLGEKVGMTQVFDEQNCLITVTVVKAVLCFVSLLKNEKRIVIQLFSWPMGVTKNYICPIL